MRSSNNVHKKDTRAGFTLVELMVTVGIIMIITAVVIVRYGAFNSAVLLKSQAYEMALNLREAQVFAISARGDQSAFRDGYGLYFNTATPNQYRLFFDRNGSGFYNSGEEVGEPFIIDARFMIRNICTTACTSSQLSVLFKRPDFDANLWIYGGSPASARIVITPASDADIERSVTVSNTGQISVE